MELKIRNYVIEAPIEKILNTVKRELTNGKLRDIKQRGTEYCVTCPHHGGGVERNPDCYINASKESELEYGYFHCFACGFSGRLSKFIGECFDADEKFGEDWLISNFGVEVFEQKVSLEAFNIKEEETEPDYIDESVLDNMQSYHPYMTQRKLSTKVCETFKIKYDTETQSLVFPVYDEHNRLYMLTRRSVNSKKFVIDSNKEKPVYLLYFINKKHIKEVTVCESQINALYLWSLGIPAIALFGTGTQHQYDLLNKSEINHYYLCFDGDSAGVKGTKRFIKNIKKDVFIDVIEMPSGKDANDLTAEEFDSLNILDSYDWLQKQKEKSF